MEKDAFVFIGRSGCGKGTQKDLLIKHLETLGMPYLSVYTGDELRSFMSGQGFIAKEINKVVSAGGLVPSFVASTMWSKILMEKYQSNQTIIFDGSPRTIFEAYEMEGAMQFLGFIHPTVVYINVSNDWSRERLTARGRGDDDLESINKRLAWFDSSVIDVVNYYKAKSYYQFLDINGEQTIPQVADEIMKKLPYLNNAPANPTANRSYSYVSSPESGTMPSSNDNPPQNPV